MNTTLHTRYRPISFNGIIGQNAVKKSLKAALKAERSHTFLFYGPSGCGKTSIARIAAKEVGSDEKDIKEIDAATFTGIDDMRAVTSVVLNYMPLGKDAMTSIIIDECHRLSAQAWSSLLKALEEPPSWVYWFLCTTDIAKIPANIKTRCTKYELKLVPSDEIYDLIAEIAEKEKIFPNKIAGNGEGIMELCAKEAHGSPRQGLVNLGICAEVKDRKEAAELLKSATESSGAFELAKALLAGRSWGVIQDILQDLKDQDAEGVRHVIQSYMTGVILRSKTENEAGSAMEILSEFSQPFLSGNGVSPVVMACGRIILGK